MTKSAKIIGIVLLVANVLLLLMAPILRMEPNPAGSASRHIERFSNEQPQGGGPSNREIVQDVLMQIRRERGRTSVALRHLIFCILLNGVGAMVLLIVVKRSGSDSV